MCDAPFFLCEQRELGRLPDQDDFMAERPFKVRSSNIEKQLGSGDSMQMSREVLRGKGEALEERRGSVWSSRTNLLRFTLAAAWPWDTTRRTTGSLR